MKRLPVILIFDIGKTNKKLLLFDEHYAIVHSESEQWQEIKDEDGFICEDITKLTWWIRNAFQRLLLDDRYNIKAINFSAYGASFVYLDSNDNVLLPLYNYLKPYPTRLQKQFDNLYNRDDLFAVQTASPALGSLNSGMQLYRIKHEQPKVFARIRYALHLPQYVSFLISGVAYDEITSIGCHTALWNFTMNDYHSWVDFENMREKFPSLALDASITNINGLSSDIVKVGSGLHDSSAALIPYLSNFREPFILISTGTWCISLNPFDITPLTRAEIESDILCYLSYKRTPVKASRLFAGNDHEQHVKRLAVHFNKKEDYYKEIVYDSEFDHIQQYHVADGYRSSLSQEIDTSTFDSQNLSCFDSYEQAYHVLIRDIVDRQYLSTQLVLKSTSVKRIFVDGGFSMNNLYMHMLARAFPNIEIFAASIPQASAMGAALAIRKHWNSKALPDNLIHLQYYAAAAQNMRL